MCNTDLSHSEINSVYSSGLGSYSMIVLTEANYKRKRQYPIQAINEAEPEYIVLTT